MPITIAISKSQHRYDGTIPPQFSATGLVGTGRLLIADQHSTFIGGSPYFWSPLNRTIINAEARLIEMYGTTFTLGTNVTQTGGSLILTKTVATEFSGASYGPVSGDGGLEAYTSDTGSCGISLQSGTVDYNWKAGGSVEHALILENNGVGQIWELGILKQMFTYSIGDKVLLIRQGNFVKYYLIRTSTTKELVLLRTTRSKVTASMNLVPLLYENGAQLNEVLIYIGVQATTNFDVFGVINSTFQDWNNQGGLTSLGEKTVTKGKQEEVTYFSDKKNILSLSLNCEWRLEVDYQEFKDFFEWHDIGREFIFVDKARKRLRTSTPYPLRDFEMFAKFTGSFSDSPIGGDLYACRADIVESLKHYVMSPDLADAPLDTTPPSMVPSLGGFATSSHGLTVQWGPASD